MFVTFCEDKLIPRGEHVHNGCTVTIKSKGKSDMYLVRRYDASGNWVEWTAHVDELIGFIASKIAV